MKQYLAANRAKKHAIDDDNFLTPAIQTHAPKRWRTLRIVLGVIACGLAVLNLINGQLPQTVVLILTAIIQQRQPFGTLHSGRV